MDSSRFYGDIIKTIKILIALLFSIYFIFYFKSNFICEHKLLYINFPLKDLLYFLYFAMINFNNILFNFGNNILSSICSSKLILYISAIFLQIFIPLIIAIYFRFKRKFYLFFIFLFIFAFSIDLSSWAISLIDNQRISSTLAPFFSQEKIDSFKYLFSYFNLTAYQHTISLILEIFAHLLMFISIIGLVISAFI